MAWIELHQSLPTHRKTKKLTRALGLKVPRDVPKVVGHLCMFWLWSIDNAPYGDLSSIDVEDIADAAGWDKEPEIFMDAMRESGFIEGNAIHDWGTYIGRLLERLEHQREINRQKQQRYRDRKRVVSGYDDGDKGVSNREITSDVTGYSEVTGDIEKDIDGISPEWVDFVKRYENNIGMMPTGAALERLVSYYTDLGADVMRYAVEYVNTRQATNPKRFLDKVLNNWFAKGIRTADEAKAYTAEFQRNIEIEKGMKNGRAGTNGNGDGQHVIDGKFY